MLYVPIYRTRPEFPVCVEPWVLGGMGHPQLFLVRTDDWLGILRLTMSRPRERLPWGSGDLIF